MFCAVFRKVGESNGTGVFQKQPQQVAKQVVGQVAPNNHVQTPGGANAVVENKMVPIQITLPAQPGSDLGQRVLSIQVPASALQGNQLHKILTGESFVCTSLATYKYIFQVLVLTSFKIRKSACN